MSERSLVKKDEQVTLNLETDKVFIVSLIFAHNHLTNSILWGFQRVDDGSGKG